MNALINIPSTLKTNNRLFLVAGFLIIAVVLLLCVVLKTTSLTGDGSEYTQMVVSFSHHASPDRQEGDLITYNLLREKSNLTIDSYPNDGFVTTDSGELYSYHFWLYPLFILPAYKFLQFTGMNELGAFKFTNYFLFTGAIALILFYSGFSSRQKIIFSALLIFSPVSWYLLWSSPEIFSCSSIVASVALFTKKKYYPAVLLAAIATTQNPPIIFLAIYIATNAVLEISRSKKYTGMFLLLACLLPAIIPSIFFVVKYGSPNLIYETGYASFGAISFQRTFDFFFDLNMGLLPWLPIVFVYFSFLLFVSWHRGRRTIYGLSIVILAMVMLAETALNWNSGAAGIMRYAVWIIPLVIWGVVESQDLSKRIDKTFISAALISQLIISIPIMMFFMTDQVQHNILARYVLDNYPYLYSPVPETFAERTLGREGGYFDNLPVIYCNSDRNATKILTDYNGLQQLESLLKTEPEFLAEQELQHQGETGLFYVNAAHGEMKCTEGSNGRD